ncbi:DNA internalization-related competence protein ComEC/Rec2 [Allokutzneria oryzae]|uniref:DNA internalization-related competence protein ComEC/Rec2 n=1 Tax=Allokutzneria oryzae TaxID=1378989 RepID=A0ABV6ABI3_9PSEU
MSLDLRLVPAALAVWAVALVGLHLGWFATALCGVAAVVTAVWSALLVVRRGTGRLASGVLAASVLAGAAAVVVTSHAYPAATHPLRELAARGATATVKLTLSEDPRPLRTKGYGGRPAGADQVAVRARLNAVQERDGWVERGGGVLLLASAATWAKLLPEQEVTATGALIVPRGGDFTVAVLRVRGPPIAVGPAPGWQTAAEQVRNGLRDASQVLSAELAGLLPALVVGDTSALSPRVVEEFQASGLAHLLAVSGANLAIVCGAVLLLFRLLSAGPRMAGAAAALALVCFVVLARPEPSVLRAAAMGGVTLLALVLGRKGSALPALAGAVIVLLLFDPSLATTPGFALSVLATSALVVLAPRWAGALRDRGVPVGLAEAIAVPAAAQLATAPVIAAISGQISLVAIPANLLAAPVVAPATVLGVLAAVASTVHESIAEFLVHLAGPEVWWLITVGRHAAAVPDNGIAWPAGVLGGLLLTALLVVLVVLWRSPRFRILLVLGVVALLLVTVPAKLISPQWPVRGWAAVACDVGQGDAVVLAVAEPGRAVLVDTGPEPLAVNACLDRLDVDRIPLVVLSHLHADHIGGLAAVLAERSVGAVAVGPLREPAWAMKEVRKTVEEAGVALIELGRDQRMEWPGLVLEVLAPLRSPEPRTSETPLSGTVVNDSSLVLRAHTAAGRVLLTGDIELSTQAELLASTVDLSAEVLKVPHHGSRYSLPRFLAAVRPRVALICVGSGNDYGHPSPLVLQALADVRVLRTDQDGDVAVLSTQDGLATARRGEPRPPPRR